MAIIPLQTNTIHNGQSPTYLQGGDYLTSVAIDPDANVSTSIKKIAGTITPTANQTFVEIDGNPMWIKPNPKTSNTMIYTDEGKVYSYDSDLVSRATDEAGTELPLILTNASGNGLAYYNNYYYFIKDNNIDRYGAMDSDTAITLEEDWLTNLETVTTIVGITTDFQTSTSSQFYIGDGQTFSEAAQMIQAGKVSAATRVNRLRIQAKNAGSGTSQTLRVRIYNLSNSTTEPTGAVAATATFTVDNTLRTYDIDLTSHNIAASTWNYWIRIDKEAGFSSGEFVQLTTTAASAITSSALLGWNGSAWAAPSSADQKDLAFYLMFAEAEAVSLTNTTYPLNGSVTIPNHVAKIHSDNKLYIGDFANGRGVIHKIQTLDSVSLYNTNVFPITVGMFIYGADSKASAEILAVSQGFYAAAKGSNSVWELTVINQKGAFIEDESLRNSSGSSLGNFEATNVGKVTGDIELNALTLPADMKPVALESFGSDLAILAINSTDNDINQGEARLYLWDTFDVSFYREVKLPYATATALLSHNGIPFIWGGDERGYSFSRYVGGDSVQELFYVDDGVPPFAGAVTGDNNRILWGTRTTYPLESASVMAWGSRNAAIPNGLHNIAQVVLDSQDKQVTALTVATKSDDGLVIGARSSSESVLAKSGGEYQSVFRTKLQNVGREFVVKQLTIPLAKQVNSNMSIGVKVYVDNESRSKVLPTINSANYGGKDKVVIYPDITGESNYFIEFTWTGTEALPILLPLGELIETLNE